MVKQLGKNIFSVFLGIIALQIILPVVIASATVGIKLYQECIIESAAQEQLTDFVISANDPDFILHGDDEFSFKGKWYDIKEIAFNNGTYSIKALSDEDETQLQKVSCEQSSESNLHVVKRVLPFFLLYFETSDAWHQAKCNSTIKVVHNSVFISRITDLHREIFIPPPVQGFIC